MNIFLGTISFFVILFLVLNFTKNNSKLRIILLFALMVRTLLVVVGQLKIITLPDSNADAIRFLEQASAYSSKYGLSILLELYKNDSYIYSKILSIFYSLFGESILMAQMINVAAGVICVYLVYFLCNEIWDKRSAIKAAWVVSIFPSLIYYSALTLREIFICLFLLLTLISLKKYLKDKNFFSFIIVILLFYILMLFHGPLILGGVVIITIILMHDSKKILLNLFKFKINLKTLFSLLLIVIILNILSNNQFNIQYLGNFDKIFNIEWILFKLDVLQIDNAAYPYWLSIENVYDLFTIGIIKIFYFLFGPFAWNISSFVHIFGFFDGMLQILLVYLMCKNWHNIRKDQILNFYLILLIVYLIIYGISIGNFGAGLRHRTKFVVILIILAAPKLLTFSFKKNNR